MPSLPMMLWSPSRRWCRGRLLAGHYRRGYSRRVVRTDPDPFVRRGGHQHRRTVRPAEESRAPARGRRRHYGRPEEDQQAFRPLDTHAERRRRAAIGLQSHGIRFRQVRGGPGRGYRRARHRGGPQRAVRRHGHQGLSQGAPAVHRAAPARLCRGGQRGAERDARRGGGQSPARGERGPAGGPHGGLVDLRPGRCCGPRERTRP